MKLFKNKKGVWMFILLAVGLGFSLLAFLFFTQGQDKPEQAFIGENQLAILQADQKAQGMMVYIDQSAQYASEQAIHDLAGNGGMYSGEEKCGTYQGYALWRGKQEVIVQTELGKELKERVVDCPPNPKKNFAGFFNDNLIPYFASYPEMVAYNYHIILEQHPKSLEVLGIALHNLELPIFKRYQRTMQEKVSYASSFSEYEGFPWPVVYEDQKVTSCFGYRNVEGGSTYHKGIDMRTNGIKEVIAVADGKVERINECWGKVVINHGGYKTSFTHLQDWNVKPGDTVQKGDVMGRAGARGPKQGVSRMTCTKFSDSDPEAYKDLGYHLHFEMEKNGEKVNPVCYFDEEVEVQEKLIGKNCKPFRNDVAHKCTGGVIAGLPLTQVVG